MVTVLALQPKIERWEGLLDYNPASHAVWEVSRVLFVILGVIALVEGWDWLREALRRRARRHRGEPELDGRYWLYREPESELRRRHYRRVEARRRTWSEDRPNEPAEPAELRAHRGS